MDGNARILSGVAAVTAAVLLSASTGHSRVDAEPHPYQLWTSAEPAKQGRVFVGATLMVLRQSAVTIRPESVRFNCTRGVIRSSGRVRYAPVTTVRIKPAPYNEPGPVIAVWTCLWRVPPGTAGLRMTASYTRSAIDVDPTTGRETGRSSEGGRLSWRIGR